MQNGIDDKIVREGVGQVIQELKVILGEIN